jgi:hypothetical protein
MKKILTNPRAMRAQVCTETGDIIAVRANQAEVSCGLKIDRQFKVQPRAVVVLGNTKADRQARFNAVSDALHKAYIEGGYAETTMTLVALKALGLPHE